AQPLERLEMRDARKPQVEQHEVEVVVAGGRGDRFLEGLGLEDLDRLAGAGRGQALEHGAHPVADQVVVVDEEDLHALSSPCAMRSEAWRARSIEPSSARSFAGRSGLCIK